MNAFSTIRHIAFDADDTLWQNEDFYHACERNFGSVLANYMDEDVARKAFAKTESNNMELLGYGAKAMTISMVQTAIELVPNINPSDIEKLVNYGKSLMQMPVILLPGALETITHFAKTHHVFIVTKGDLIEQERKYHLSPFYKMGIEYIVLSGKEPEDYTKLLRRLGIQPEEFMMVGNSPRSDVLAPLSIGASAAYVPYAITWAHEHTELAPHPRMLSLDHIDQLISLM
jgi:putative hydrolase of the HAD superfamily